jgi:hypothetical protein
MKLLLDTVNSVHSLYTLQHQLFILLAIGVLPRQLFIMCLLSHTTRMCSTVTPYALCQASSWIGQWLAGPSLPQDNATHLLGGSGPHQNGSQLHISPTKTLPIAGYLSLHFANVVSGASLRLRSHILTDMVGSLPVVLPTSQ